MSDTPPPRDHDDLRDPPPVLGTWGNLYAFVITTLGLAVLGLWLITKSYE